MDDTGHPPAHPFVMSLTDYLLNGLLVALVFLQVRGRRMSVRMLLFPVAIVAGVAVEYLHSIPTAGNDLLLVVVGALAGLVLGGGCGLATRVFRRDTDGAAVAKAGVLAVVLWVAGVGARIAFALYATHGGGAAVVRFSAAHHITSTAAWVAALILMALVEVISRNGVLALRYRALQGSGRQSGGLDGLNGLNGASGAAPTPSWSPER